MATYLVRDKTTKQICGIVQGDSVEHISWAVDEFGNPELFEVFDLRCARSVIWFCTQEEAEQREHKACRTSEDEEPFNYSKEWTHENWQEEFEQNGFVDQTVDDYKRECEDEYKRSSFVPDPIYLDWNEGLSHVINGWEEVEWKPLPDIVTLADRQPRRRTEKLPKEDAPKSDEKGKRILTPRNPNWKPGDSN